MKTRKILAAAVSLAIAATAVAGLAACGVSNDSGDGGHVHSFDETKWSTSEKGHWHPATCGHDFALGDYADHTMVSGECTVCHYQSGSTNPGDGGSTVPDDPNVPDDPILEDSPMWFKRDSENSEAQNLEIVNDLGGASGAHYRVTVDLAAGEAFYFYLDKGDGSEPDYESFKLQYITTNGNYFKTVGDYGNLAANGGGTYQFDIYVGTESDLAAEGTVTEVTYTFYFYNAKGWSDVNIYTYGCYQLPWGTVSMTTATDLGEKWYQYSFTAPESKIKGKELSVIIYNPKNQDAQRVSIGDTSVSDSGSPITMDSNTYYISGAGNGKWSTTKDGISTVALYAMLPVVGKFYLGA